MGRRVSAEASDCETCVTCPPRREVDHVTSTMSAAAEDSYADDFDPEDSLDRSTRSLPPMGECTTELAAAAATEGGGGEAGEWEDIDIADVEFRRARRVVCARSRSPASIARACGDCPQWAVASTRARLCGEGWGGWEGE